MGATPKSYAQQQQLSSLWLLSLLLFTLLICCCFCAVVVDVVVVALVVGVFVFSFLLSLPLMDGATGILRILQYTAVKHIMYVYELTGHRVENSASIRVILIGEL